MNPNTEPARWHLDRRVPIALIAAIAMQTAGALMWAGAVSERLAFLEARAERDAGLVERTARLEERTKHMSGALTRIETKLDNVIAAR